MPAPVVSELRAPAAGPADGVLGDVLRRAAGRGPDDLLLTTPDTGGSWTAAELLADAESLAAGLLARHAPGARIATCLGNGPAPVLVQLGVALAGMTLVPVNPRSRPAEVEHALRLSGAVLALAAEEVAGNPVADLCAAVDGVEVLRVGTDWRAGLPWAAPGDLPVVEPESLAQVQFTSGTTGRAKGVLITHAGMVATGTAFAQRLGPTAGRVWCNPMPLFHTAGNVLGVVGALSAGAEHVVLPFAPEPVLQVLRAHRVSMLSAAPTLLDLLAAAGPPDLPDLRVLFTGGMTVTPAFVDRVEAVFGARLSITFGMTETCGAVLQTSPEDPDPVRRETVGAPLAGTDVRVADPDGAPVPLGTPGELWVRGARITRGYLDDPVATAEAIDPEGWLHTGDLAEMTPAGACRVVGRLKDMIKTGGENVSPVEVEEVLVDHPDVARAAVVGVPDPRWGELVVAFVVPAGDRDPSPAELTAHCRDRLAPFKVPRSWRVVDALPMTASAKVQRAELRRVAAGTT
ncbi:class I adenylate-forming enzyme family protein [Modestobacter sp. VKM Ac-2986]|uniref:class I adenylate-forming enzyme family protein n=1 Tax=Modestobacter sp. VKM Ac-2986 TaxID=3004140 RepID=UPI0022AB41FD|nr:class I adenylate-forming enzyme family protein [Modestobacter sp. VKM Ac-2986]MCZ2828844.1 class I adenylate-forming enzyme family protein [Modestobacter sp. VKM Ac-2986]